MIIKYIPEHVWQKAVVEDPLSLMGKSSRAQLRATLKVISETTVTYSFEPLTEEILAWFTPLYTAKISSKTNPKIFDIYSTTLGKDTPYAYYALILKEDGVPLGATIFSKRKKTLSIAYRIYPNSWTQGTMQANPSLYTEYLINMYAYAEGFTMISHGRDRNPYGPNSYVGLAGFKLSIGCTAHIPSKPIPVEEFDTDSAVCDTFIFEYPEEGRRITKGYLICAEDMCERYIQSTKYPDLVRVETIIRKEA
jgi:hypothetical protein